MIKISLANSLAKTPSSGTLNSRAMDYAEKEPKRAEVDALRGPTVLEFGSPWCGWCRRAQPLIAQALSAHPQLRHIKIADSSGRRLGRSFTVKLWPTLVFLRDGKEVARLVRPGAADEIRAAVAKITQ
jgi:thioredoxin 1